MGFMLPEGKCFQSVLIISSVEPELKLVDKTICFVVSSMSYMDLKTK